MKSLAFMQPDAGDCRKASKQAYSGQMARALSLIAQKYRGKISWRLAVVDHRCCWCNHCCKEGFLVLNRSQPGRPVGHNIVDRSCHLAAADADAGRDRQQAAVAIAIAGAWMLLYVQGLLCWGCAEQVMHAGALGFEVALGHDMQAWSKVWVQDSQR